MEAQRTPQGYRQPKRGLFRDGVWHCECTPRLPADKFQVKNGGKNHGRWFYTCQKPQPSRCGFFLWSDDAKAREASAVLSNSTTEPAPAKPAPAAQKAPQTPRKQQKIGPLLTPSTKGNTSAEKPSSKSFDAVQHDPIEEEEFTWSSSADEELAEIAKTLSNETISGDDQQQAPREAPKTPEQVSPSKRTYDEMQLQSGQGQTPDRGNRWMNGDDVFMTPSTTNKPDSLGPLLSPIRSPPTSRSLTKTEDGSDRHTASSSLANEVFRILSPVKRHISPALERELVDLLNCHDLRTQGISKGRDITRLAIQAKDKKIAELQGKITGLEADLETGRTVIAHLKQDIATSPKKSRYSRHELTRSDV